MRIKTCNGSAAYFIALALLAAPALSHADMAIRQAPSPALGAAPVVTVVQGTSQSVMIRPRPDGLSGFAAFRADHPGLTRDQLSIGYQLCGGMGMYRPDCPDVTDRALLLRLIRQTRDSLDFMSGIDTPLTAAAARGDPELVTAILAKGFAADMPRGGGRQIDMALQRAVFGMKLAAPNTNIYFWGTQPGHMQTIRLLLKAGANPRAKTPPMNLPLAEALNMHITDAASRQARFEMIQLLLEHGADPKALGPNIFSNLADIHDDALLGLFLAHGLDISKSQSSGLLVTAMQSRNPSMAKLALAKGADPDTRPPGQNAPLITQADADSAMVLLNGGANPAPCWKVTTGYTSGACGMPQVLKHPALLRLMLAKGANPNGDGIDTPLWNALQREQHICAVLPVAVMPGAAVPGPVVPSCPDDSHELAADAIPLLQAGADPNLRSHDELPLMLVDDREHEVIKLLLDKGARMDSATPEGYRLGPVSMAMATGRPYLAVELARRSKDRLGGDERWALLLAARDGNINLVNALAQHGADLNAPGMYGETALHYAVLSNNAAMIKRLLALGAKPDPKAKATRNVSRTETSLNPLVIVANLVWFAVAPDKEKPYRATHLTPPEFLEGGITPLMLAVESGNLQTTEALLQGGAKPTEKTDSDYTPLLWARYYGNQEMRDLLAKYNK